jgi:hypothetical protein
MHLHPRFFQSLFRGSSFLRGQRITGEKGEKALLFPTENGDFDTQVGNVQFTVGHGTNIGLMPRGAQLSMVSCHQGSEWDAEAPASSDHHSPTQPLLVLLEHT